MSNPDDPQHPSGDRGGDGAQGSNPPPPPPPYGQTPYPQDPSSPPPYGQSAYGQSPYGGPSSAPAAAKGTDAVSIIGFVLSLTCCLSIVGAIMGAIGLRRTKDNQRRGRWAAVSALVIGVLGTLAFAGIVVFGVFIANSVVTPENAEVGICADVTEDNDEVSFVKRDCAEDHDAEVIVVERADAFDGDLAAADTFEVCAASIDPEDFTALESFESELTFGLVVNDPADVAPSDRFICYIERSDGAKLTSKVLP